MKYLIATFLVATVVAATDFSQMSTQELAQMRGNVPVEERDAFRAEMQKRMQTMSPEERRNLMGSQPGTMNPQQNMNQNMNQGGAMKCGGGMKCGGSMAER